MKKLLLLLTLFIGFVYAETCPLFSVDYIENDGSFRQIGCFETFDEAENKRSELGNEYVVRTDKSLSPRKIVSMGKGFAYSYSGRSGSSIQNIYEKIDDKHNGSGATTYLTSHYEMTYDGTEFYTEYYGYSGGYVKVTMNGFTGYADLEYVDLVPTKFIELQIPIVLGGNDKVSYEEPFNVICEQNYYEAVKKGNYTDLVFTFHRAWSSNGDKALTSSVSIGVAPAFMEEGVKYYSNDGINFYKDSSLTLLAGSYYNYYQFLPVRTYTNISADVMNAFLKSQNKSGSIIEGKALDFINAQNKYGVNAATILSMAIHESAWGTSNIAKKKNNLFGWGAFDDATSNATTYNSVADCVASQMGDNLANYLDVSSGGLYFSMSLGNKGGGFITKYASDPYWAEKISHYYYELDKFSKGYDGTLTDFDSVKIALVKNITNVYNSENEVLYTTENKRTGYQKNLIVPVIEEGENLSKINTSNPINGEGVIYPIQLSIGTLVDYDKTLSVGYIKNDDLKPLNYENSKTPDEEIPPIEVPEQKEFEVLSFVEQINVGELLSIKGNALLTSHDFSSPEKTKYTLIFKDLLSGETKYSFPLETIKEEGMSLNDGYDYSYCGFNGEIDISSLDVGRYVLNLKIENSDTKEIELRIFNFGTKVFKNDISYILKQNTIYGNRIELEKTSASLNYSLINKPENRESMFAFDNLNFVEENGKTSLNIDGVGMIYYLNYDKPDDISFILHLIGEDNSHTEVQATTKTCDINYSEIFGSSYDMSNICFTGNIDISNLQGNYEMILEIRNGEYADFIRMNTNSELNMEHGDYQIIKNVLNETILKAKKEV